MLYCIRASIVLFSYLAFGCKSVLLNQSFTVSSPDRLFVLILCCSIFCYRCMIAFVVFDLVFQYKAKRLAEKVVFEMTCFLWGGA